jgi:hypothetical protein
MVKKMSHKDQHLKGHSSKNKSKNHQNVDHPHHHRHHEEFTEEFTKSTIQTKGPEGVSTKTVTHRSSLVNGKRVDVKVEEITNPDGTTNVTETINEGGEVRSNKFTIKGDQTKPAIQA